MRFDPPSATERAWNPYTWRLRQLAALRGDPAHAARRRRLRQELLLAEANELAQGIRHVSVMYGKLDSDYQVAQVEGFLGQVDRWLAGAAWSRIRGGEDHVIVASAGVDADERIGAIRGIAVFSNPGYWVVTDGPCPHLG